MNKEAIWIPKIKTVLYNAVNFVAKAISSDPTKYAIDGVCIEPKYIVATDSRRIHRAKIKRDYKPGIYDVIRHKGDIILLATSNTEKKFPKYQDVMPNHNNYFEISPCNYPAEIVLGVLGKKNISVNLDYLNDVFESIDCGWNVYYGEPDEPIRLVSRLVGSEIYEAVIMPIGTELANYKFETVKQEKG